MSYNRVYIVDFKRLVRWCIPHSWRKQLLLFYVNVLVYPISTLFLDFRLYRKAKQYQLSITPQVCSLTRLLNDKYDSRRRRIYITDGVDKSPVYIYVSAELKPKYLHRRVDNKPLHIYTRGESGIIKDDFIVNIPSAVPFDINELSTILRFYKLAGTKFKIQTIGR